MAIPASSPKLASGAPSAPAPHSQDRRLRLEDILKLMVADGVVAAAEADKLARARGSRGEHPLEFIALQKWRTASPPHALLTLDWLVEWLAGKLGVPFLHIDPLKIDLTGVTQTMSNAYAERFRVLPVAVDRLTVTVATSEPFVRAWADDLQEMIKREVKFVFANPQDIKRYMGEFYTLARSMKRAQESSKGDLTLRNFEQLVELGRHGNLDANDTHVVHIVDWLWQYAFEQRASDIHIEPRRDVGVVRFRIDGVLHQVYTIPQPVLLAMTSRIKLLARMEIVEKRRPQDGRIKTLSPDGDEVELRISTMPTAFGEKIVMRIFTPEVLVRDYNDLGFTEDDRERWEGMIKQPNGIILVTGPTGSGKTTTLYSSMKALATPEVNVCTIEDPIEMIEPAFNQMQVQPVIGVDFAAGVRTLMRQDPDIIMVGEIRDPDTADMAVKKPSDPPDDESWRMMTAPWRADKPAQTMAAEGCLECRMTGYYGRIGLYEIMTLTPAIRRLITQDANDRAIREQAYKDGMKPLRVSGAMKVAGGVTTAEEVMKVAPLA
jgi:general secretion pathway protein E